MIMATCGGYSFERTILETVELVELKNTVYTDLELAALVGETLRKATNCQEEEIAHLKCLIEERNQELKKEKKRCSSFASLEVIYDQPVNKLDSEIAFLRSLNEECMTKIRKYHTLLECSAVDQQSLSRVLHDLDTTKSDIISESSDHCILCTCSTGYRSSLCDTQHDQNHDQLAEMMTLRVQLQRDLDNAAGDRRNMQEKIDVLSRQVHCLSKTIMEFEEEHRKSMLGGDSEDEQGCQAGDDIPQWGEEETRQSCSDSTPCSTSTPCCRCDKCSLKPQGLREKPSGRFANLVHSLMPEKSNLFFPE